MDSQRQEESSTDPGGPEGGSKLAAVATVAGVIALALLVAFALFGGGSGYNVTASFQNAGQLVRGNPVQVGGTSVGTVSDIELGDGGDAIITMELDDELRPLHRGTRATIRATSLSGIANRYVAIDPGPNDAEEIEDGGRIAADDTAAPVDLDQLFNTLDPKTRAGLTKFVRGQGTYYAARGEDARRSLRYLAPALSSTSRLTREIALDKEIFSRFITDTASLVSAVAERRTDLAGLVANTSTTATAIADESASLSRALQLLPGTLRKANTTFVNLRSTLDDLELLVQESKPATRELAPFLRRLRPLVREARPTIRDLRLLISRAGPANDLIDLNRRAPRLADLAENTFPRAIRTMDDSQDELEYARLYTPDLAGWITKFAEAAANYDANGHFARVQPVFLPFSYDAAENELEPKPASERLTGLEFGQWRRCPGGGVQPPP
ncbi:MAG TPA: MlaD family protein, partial [Thermoleophilaceae bacterium]|nr:MlaD family protein [Thermoleophilaceae bacterium]